MEKLFPNTEIKIGVVIGTHAAVPYIHLHLESWRRHCSKVPLLVCDDCSSARADLKLLCQEYGAEFYSHSEHLGHVTGDLSTFVVGTDWASRNGIDLLVKFSRRFVPLIEWQADLRRFAYDSQYATYSGICRHHGFGFRTECMAMHVPSWISHGGLDPVRSHADARAYCLVENVVHQGAEKVQGNACLSNRIYEAMHPRPIHAEGYGNWSLLGDNRVEPRPDVLWHEACQPVEYHRAALQYSISRYRPDEFRL